MSFVHLRVQSEYSFLRSVLKVKEIAEESVIALTDRQFHGMFDFWEAMNKSGHKAIFGLDQKVRNKVLSGHSHVLILAHNKQALHDLLALNALANQREDEALDLEDLCSLKKEDFTFLLGSVTHEIGMLNAKNQDCFLVYNWYEEFLRDSCYFEIQHHSLVEPWEDRCTQFGLLQQSFPVVLTNECVYLDGEAKYHHIFLASDRSPSLERSRFDYSDQFYIKNDFEMYEVLEEIKAKFVRGERAEEAFHNTQRIADQCEYIDLSVSGYFMPETENADEVLEKATLDALPKRYSHPTKDIYDRVRYELSVVKNMKFSGYFTILLDIISFAHAEGIFLGPGRGSAAGSAVMYALHVTDIDPIKFDLLFERFLNPERISMPDVDIDVDNDRRSEVIQYIVKRFGKDRVAQIANFSELGGKSALRMVCESFGLPPFEKDRMSKLVEFGLEKDLESNPSLVAEYETNPVSKKMIDLALFFEKKGLKKNTGIHASGVVISSKPLLGMVPVMKGDALDIAVGIDMEGVEHRGLIKYDILGLKQLSAFRNCLKAINRSDIQTLQDIPMEDEKVFDYIASGQTVGLFQLGLAGQIAMDMKVSSIEDLIAINGLNRPGPKDQIPLYVRRKFGLEPINYFHDALAPVLGYTYGIIIYQEQIMKIAQVICGYTLGEADLLRRAIGKKKKEVLEAEESRFIEKAIQNGHTKELGKELFDLIVKFADYGFNRSHATSYAVLGYYSAWFKLYYPNIFLAYMMEAHRTDGEDGRTSPKVLRQEAMRLGIKMESPDVNSFSVSYVPLQKKIRYGLGSILGVGINTALQIVQRAPYENFKDFVLRSGCDRGTIKSLLQSGALDSIISERMSYLQRFEVEMDLIDYDFSIFDVLGNADELIDAKPITPFELLQFERETLGTYISSHPVEYFKREMEQYSAKPYESAVEGSYFKACGVLVSGKVKLSKKKKRYVLGSVENGESSIVFIGYERFLESLAQPIESMVGSFVAIDGKYQEGKVNANKLIYVPLDKAVSQHIVEDCPEVYALLKRAKKGNTEVVIKKPSGLLEKWTKLVTWDDNFEQFEVHGNAVLV